MRLDGHHNFFLTIMRWYALGHVSTAGLSRMHARTHAQHAYRRARALGQVYATGLLYDTVGTVHTLQAIVFKYGDIIAIVNHNVMKIAFRIMH